jgi:hypothetical protein
MMWHASASAPRVARRAAGLEECSAKQAGGPHEGECDVVVAYEVATAGFVEELVEAVEVGGGHS